MVCQWMWLWHAILLFVCVVVCLFFDASSLLPGIIYLWHFCGWHFVRSVYMQQYMDLQLAEPVDPYKRCVFFAGGGHSNGKRGYQGRPWHGHTKSTLITYFSGMKIDPKYVFLHAFFSICPSCPFQNQSIWPKTHPFYQFCMFLHP